MWRNFEPPIFMSTRLSKFCAGLALAGVLVASGHAAPPATKTLPGHVPAVAARLQSTGDLSGSTQLRLAIGLPLRNQAVLDHLLQDIYDPSSPIYHHYRTPSQFAAQFSGPTEEDYQKVIAFAHQHGLTVTNTYSNRVLLDVTGTAADIEKAFNVHLRTYHHPTENRDFFAPDTDPTVDASLPILHISGLDNAGVLRKFIEPRPSGLRAVSPPPMPVPPQAAPIKARISATLMCQAAASPARGRMWGCWNSTVSILAT